MRERKCPCLCNCSGAWGHVGAGRCCQTPRAVPKRWAASGPLQPGCHHLRAGPDPVCAPPGTSASHGPASSALGKLHKSERVKRGQSLPGLTTHPKGNFSPKLVLMRLIHWLFLLLGNPEQRGHPLPLCSAAIHRPVTPAREALPASGKHPPRAVLPALYRFSVSQKPPGSC